MGKVLPEDEMPPASANGYAAQSSRMNFIPGQLGTGYLLDSGSPLDAGPEIKRKKGNGVEGKSIEEELCRICGDRASGYHYNALSCEGCKGFFRRSITKTATYVCKYGGNCEMDMWMRRKCQACRLRRCREVGMKEECLLSEDQCKARDARRKAKQNVHIKKEVHSPDSFGQCPVYMDPDPSLDIKPTLPLTQSSSGSGSGSNSPFSPQPDNADIIKRLNTRHREMIQFIVALQQKFEFADSEEYDKTLGEFKPTNNDKTLEPDTLMNSMASTFVLITQLIVEFAKALPGFHTLSKEDKIVLLKSSTTEVMAIRAARCYDLDSRAIVFGNGQPCTLENMKAISLGHFADLLYEFGHSMALQHTDNAEYALLTAICIFQERPGLLEREKVEEVQCQFVECLQSYLNIKRGRSPTSLARFLSRLTELRTISAEHSKVLVEMDLQKNGFNLPDIIKQIILVPPEGN